MGGEACCHRLYWHTPVRAPVWNEQQLTDIRPESMQECLHDIQAMRRLPPDVMAAGMHVPLWHGRYDNALALPAGLHCLAQLVTLQAAVDVILSI